MLQYHLLIRPHSFRLKSLQDLGTMRTVGMLSLGIGVATDVVIAFSLCFFLRNLRTGHRQCVRAPSLYRRAKSNVTFVGPQGRLHG